MARPFLWTKDVAEQLGVSVATIRRWTETGDLVPAWTTPGGQARYRPEDVEAFLAKREPAA